MTICFRLSCLCATACLALQTAGGEPPPPTAPPPAVGAITTADDLLRALEKADANLRSLQADLRLTEQKGELQGFDKTISLRRLLFVSEPPVPQAEPVPR